MDVYSSNSSASTNYYMQSNAMLWDMGNTLVTSAEQMLYLEAELGASINSTNAYQVSEPRCHSREAAGSAR